MRHLPSKQCWYEIWSDPKTDSRRMYKYPRAAVGTVPLGNIGKDRHRAICRQKAAAKEGRMIRLSGWGWDSFDRRAAAGLRRVQ